jgi:Mycobacterium membrane protein
VARQRRAEGGQVMANRISTSVIRVAKRAWIPLVLVVVLAFSALIVSRLHKIFGSQDYNANAGGSIKIVQFNPKVVVYDITGPPGATANINYWDADANTHQVNDAPLPWSTTISTTLPSVSANIMAQSDGSRIGCKITVDGVVREQQNSDGHNAQTFCLVKSA